MQQSQEKENVKLVWLFQCVLQPAVTADQRTAIILLEQLQKKT